MQQSNSASGRPTLAHYAAALDNQPGGEDEMAEYETLQYSETGAVAWVTLNRPERLNSFNTAMADEIESVWKGLRYNTDIRCIVLTGAGDKAFCTGIDRGEDVPQPPSPFMIDDPGNRLGPKSAKLWKPVIAAVNGMAAGGAFYFLGEAEFIIAADHATFFDPHVTFGMTAAFEPILMRQYMPFAEIMRLTLMGNHERMSAERAYQIGLVSEVVPAASLLERAGEVAAAIASQPAVAVEGTVRALWTAMELSRAQALDMADNIIALGNQPEAIAEGLATFRSGQRIEWKLR
jgi:enoyl-CoA hydratase/carnithine racemase